MIQAIKDHPIVSLISVLVLFASAFFTFEKVWNRASDFIWPSRFSGEFADAYDENLDVGVGNAELASLISENVGDYITIDATFLQSAPVAYWELCGETVGAKHDIFAVGLSEDTVLFGLPVANDDCSAETWIEIPNDALAAVKTDGATYYRVDDRFLVSEKGVGPLGFYSLTQN